MVRALVLSFAILIGSSAFAATELRCHTRMAISVPDPGEEETRPDWDAPANASSRYVQKGVASEVTLALTPENVYYLVAINREHTTLHFTFRLGDSSLSAFSALEPVSGRPSVSGAFVQLNNQGLFCELDQAAKEPEPSENPDI
jgi:hypothetical protein